MTQFLWKGSRSSSVTHMPKTSATTMIGLAPQLTYDPLCYLSPGSLWCIGSSRKCIGVWVVIRICPVQLRKPCIKVQSPCTLPTLSNSTSAKACHLPLFIIQNWSKPGLCALLYVDCEVPSLCKQAHIEGDSFEPVDTVQSFTPRPPWWPLW